MVLNELEDPNCMFKKLNLRIENDILNGTINLSYNKTIPKSLIGKRCIIIEREKYLINWLYKKRCSKCISFLHHQNHCPFNDKEASEVQKK